jgi:hypothetical protein
MQLQFSVLGYSEILHDPCLLTGRGCCAAAQRRSATTRAVVLEVRETQASNSASLLHLQAMHPEHGPPLPVG